MRDYSKALDKEGWSAHYNIESLRSVVNSIKNEDVSVWSKELAKICRVGGEKHVLRLDVELV